MKYRFVLAVALSFGIAGGLIGGLANAQNSHVVRMAGSTYTPGTINARVGDVIRFVNDDAENHDVFVPTAGHAIDFGVTRPGQNVEMTARRAGRFRVECVLHEDMVVTVNVTQ